MAERDDGVSVGAQIGVRAARRDGGERHAVRLKLDEHIGAVVPGRLRE
jgi:hypothetical protein